MAVPVLLQAISIVALLVMLIVTMQMDDLPSSTPFNIMVMAVLFVVMGQLVHLVYSGEQADYIARAMQVMGMMFAYPLNLHTTLLHFKVRPPALATILMLLVPVVAIIPLFLSTGGRLIPLVRLWQGAQLGTEGTLFYLLLYYGYPMLCLAATAGLLAYKAFRLAGRMRFYSLAFFWANLAPPLVALYYHTGGLGSFNPYSMMLAWCCVATGLVTLPSRVGNWASYARELALQNSYDGYVLLDAGGRYIESNSFAKKLFPVLQSIFGAVSLKRLPDLEELVTLTAALAPGQSCKYMMNDTLLRISRIQVEYGGKYVGICIQLRNESEIHRLQTNIASIETIDYTSGFLNERTFARIAQRDYLLARRMNAPLCVMALAIDGLEEVRSHHGEDCYTYLVKHVSLTLRERLRKTDLVGRAEDGSFLVLLPASSLLDTQSIAESFRRQVTRENYSCKGTQLSPTASLGISCLDVKRHTDVERIIIEASAAMYTAQSTGGNRMCTGGPPTLVQTAFVDNASHA